MPFDGTLPRLTMADLESYKSAKLAAHPPSFLYRHRRLVPVIGCASFVAIIACPSAVAIAVAFGLESFAIYIALLGCAATIMGVITGIITSIRVRGRAYWREIMVPHPGDIKDIPADIHRAAQSLNADSFIIGTLMQDRVVLDPYLIANVGGDTIVVGIWDNDEVIYCY